MKTIMFSMILVLCLGLTLTTDLRTVNHPSTVLAAPSVCVPGPHYGDIEEDQEWCPVHNPHYVTGGIRVKSGATLTIQPGVSVYFYGGTQMWVDGTLIAVGNSSQSITITSSSGIPQPGDWGGISAEDGSNVTLGYCDISYGGGNPTSTGLWIGLANTQVSHCRIHDFANQTIYLEGVGSAPVFENVEIDNNTEGFPIRQQFITQHPTYSNVWLHDNLNNAVYIPLSHVVENVTLDGSPTALNGAPIYYEGGNVNAGTTLNIIPGTTIKLPGTKAIFVYGSLVALGTSTLPITFTSQDAIPTPGGWGGINLNPGSQANLEYCEISYGGYTNGLSIESTSSVQVRHSRIHHMTNRPVYLQGEGISPVFEDVEIDHNMQFYPIIQNRITQHPTYIDVQLHDNLVDALFISLSNVEENVTLNGGLAALNGAPVYYEAGTVNTGTTLTVSPGTTLKVTPGRSLTVNGSLVAVGTRDLPITFTTQASPPAPGGWGGISLASGSHANLAYCDISYGGGSTLGLEIKTTDVQVNTCRIHHMNGTALSIYNNIQVPTIFSNLAIFDNGGRAISIQPGAHLEGIHTTLARNGTGVYTVNGSITLTNTIVADHDIGVEQAGSGTVNLMYTLWENNIAPIKGVVNETGHLDGSVAFHSDGFHLTSSSDAIDAGVASGINNDCDGDPRPIHSIPDLGADEYRDAISRITPSDGGRLVYNDSQGNTTEILAPPAAVKEETMVVFTNVETVTPPESQLFANHAFELDVYQDNSPVTNLTFSVPVTVTIQYSDDDVEGINENTLALSYWTGSTWAPSGCGPYSRNPQGNWLAVPICHLTRFGLFGSPFFVFLPLTNR